MKQSTIKTNHEFIFNSSKNMKELSSESVNLIVTSPPYPLIKMWDDQFSTFNPKIKKALQQDDGIAAYNFIHKELNKIWKEVDRVLVPEGIVCINIGDATRKFKDSFQLFTNHSRVISYFEKLGYSVLPPILWRKQTNKPNKFMGSGMLPPNAYVTLEHEYILIFRKGPIRKFSIDEKQKRQQSVYFWEERNVWFSDIWFDLKGVSQKMNNKKLRERSGAYPFELAYRLINMYSIHGDTVLDPFFGTGTTMSAAMCLGRNSIGYEVDKNLKQTIINGIVEALKTSEKLVLDRLKRHVDFVETREKERGELKYKSLLYNFRVMTQQEKTIFLPVMKSMKSKGTNKFEVEYENPISL